MSTYERVFQHVYKSQNVSSLEIAKREIEEMLRVNQSALCKVVPIFEEAA